MGGGPSPPISSRKNLSKQNNNNSIPNVKSGGAVFIKQMTGKASTSIQPGNLPPKNNIVSEYTNRAMFKQKSMPADAKRNEDYN